MPKTAATEFKIVPHDTLMEALVHASMEFSPIKLDKINPHFKSKYASLDSVNQSIRTALLTHGITVHAGIQYREDGEAYWETVLEHVSGEKITRPHPLLYSDTMQALGSAETYARRYSLAGLLNLTPDEDTDGNDSGNRPAKTARRSAPAEKVRPRGPAQAPVASDPPKMSMDAWVNMIDDLDGFAPMQEFLTKAEKGKNLNSDPALFRRVIAQCNLRVDALQQAKKISDSELDVLDRRLGSIHTLLNTKGI